MPADLDITVLLATYNRAAILRDTLEQFERAERGELNVEFVVVDNNCTDDTREVVESFAERLPIRYVFCPTPGKNAALNMAIDTAGLGRIVLMTDDDVTPKPDWLLAVDAACRRRPDCAVFGGTVTVVWPQQTIPDWARSQFIRSFGFGHHEYADQDCTYSDGQFPHGPNYWVRREVFACGLRFDESIGPCPGNRILGDETLFLKELRDAGYTIMYARQPSVGHRIQPEVLSVEGIRRRAFTLGRGIPHLNGVSRRELLEHHPLIWRMRRWASLVRSLLRYGFGMLSLSRDRRVQRTVGAVFAMSSDLESLRLAREVRANR